MDIQHLAADAAAGAVASVLGKRKPEDELEEPDIKKLMTQAAAATPEMTSLALPPTTAPLESAEPLTSKARAIRLEQNRKAARESRRRKKVMIEELQRSVIFFSRANGTLKQQNDELSRLLLNAQAQVKSAAAAPSGEAESAVAVEAGESKPGVAVPTNIPAPTATKQEDATPVAAPTQQEQQAQAQAVATQAMYESQGFPAAAARAAAQTMSSLPPMQPGATMQAMANFQQAAAAAMQAAIQGMQGSGIAGSVQACVAPSVPPGANAQQAYTDTMTALAMQQAAAAHMGQQFMTTLAAANNPAAAAGFLGVPGAAWQAQAAAAAATEVKAEDPPASAEETGAKAENA